MGYGELLGEEVGVGKWVDYEGGFEKWLIDGIECMVEVVGW